MAALTADSADGTPIAVHDLGGTGEPLVLVHGVGLHGRVFVPLARALGADYHCFAIDLRGHGASGVPPSLDFEWTRLSEDVAAALAAIGASAPLGVVHSAGGSAALRAEALAPGSFSALYCYEPPFRTPEMTLEVSEHHPLVAQARRRRAVFASREEAFARFRDRPPFDVVTEEALWQYVNYGVLDRPDGTVALVCTPEYEATLYLAGVRSDLFELAPRLTCPITVAIGERGDNRLGRAFAHAMLDRIPTATPAVFPGLGHLGMMQDPARVAASIITAFATARA